MNSSSSSPCRPSTRNGSRRRSLSPSPISAPATAEAVPTTTDTTTRGSRRSSSTVPPRSEIGDGGAGRSGDSPRNRRGGARRRHAGCFPLLFHVGLCFSMLTTITFVFRMSLSHYNSVLLYDLSSSSPSFRSTRNVSTETKPATTADTASGGGITSLTIINYILSHISRLWKAAIATKGASPTTSNVHESSNFVKFDEAFMTTTYLQSLQQIHAVPVGNNDQSDVIFPQGNDETPSSHVRNSDSENKPQNHKQSDSEDAIPKIVQQLQQTPAHAAAEQPANNTDNESDNEQYFGGCLKISDDNHWLVEWLAYHYYVLPLRHLIVLIDPRSKTSPIEIFDRYVKDGLMTVEYMNDPFEGYTRVNRDTKADRLHMGSHLAFVTSCLRLYHDRQDRVNWVISIDTDEFIYINPETRNQSSPLYRENLPTMDQPGQILSLVKRERATHPPINPNDTACISVPRVQMTRNESSVALVESNVPYAPRLSGMDFLTLRFLMESDMFIRGKNIVDMKQLNRTYLYEQVDLTRHGSSHQILHPYCNSKPKRDQNVLAINHYPGTIKQYHFRSNDPRKRPPVDFNVSQQVDNFRPWLQGFIRLIGNETKALHLLEGAGRVDGWEPYHKPTKNLITNCTVTNGCMPTKYLPPRKKKVIRPKNLRVRKRNPHATVNTRNRIKKSFQNAVQNNRDKTRTTTQ